jgi:hypothetical protein
MGSQLRFEPEAIGTLLSITLLCATGGSLLSMILMRYSDRFNKPGLA